ncbi:YpmS family protein [Mesobacillus foraminis]|uniref:YpmS family protein n=1 Tax=Mesobacillus foraminis TaxID=279826 RepID=UPI001BEC8985|nr:YpmS family protein [Mesobacillus foraminis]MBT2755009.1 YpmS family protein [Mesobacillus foraminis]
MKNKWKLAFFILLGSVTVILITLFIMASAPVEQGENIPNSSEAVERDVSFDITTNKADLNKVINHYLEEEGFSGSIDYQVLLQDEVELYGAIPVFGQELQMKLTFEPKALKNGDLVLRQESISLGALNLPVSYVMNLIKSSYEIPEWVEIRPGEETVYVSLQTMKLKSNIKIRANKFDLKRDNISFTLLVPVD